MTHSSIARATLLGVLGLALTACQCGDAFTGPVPERETFLERIRDRG